MLRHILEKSLADKPSWADDNISRHFIENLLQHVPYQRWEVNQVPCENSSGEKAIYRWPQQPLATVSTFKICYTDLRTRFDKFMPYLQCPSLSAHTKYTKIFLEDNAKFAWSLDHLILQKKKNRTKYSEKDHCTQANTGTGWRKGDQLRLYFIYEDLDENLDNFHLRRPWTRSGQIFFTKALVWVGLIFIYESLGRDRPRPLRTFRTPVFYWRC